MGNQGEGEKKSLNLNLIGLEMNKIGKLGCGEEKKFKFEFKGLEINNIRKLRCEAENVVSRAQRSGPLLLVCS